MSEGKVCEAGGMMCRANLLALRIDIAQGRAYFCTRLKYVEPLKLRKTERRRANWQASGGNSAKPKGWPEGASYMAGMPVPKG